MLARLELIRNVAGYRSTVLIRGESGTGKELFAKALHQCGDRAGGPFVAVSCAALTETLLESELFGYAKGAFTGAQERRRGKFELAHGGTLCLDEMGDIPAKLQIDLLRVCRNGGSSGSAGPWKWRRRIMAHDWPGNVRQLENAIERAIVNSREGVLSEGDFAFLIRPSGADADAGVAPVDDARGHRAACDRDDATTSPTRMDRRTSA